jgi:hypothetical protein
VQGLDSVRHLVSRAALRTEAIRYQDAVAKDVIDRCRAAGYEDFEVGWYNIPGTIAWRRSGGGHARARPW